MTPGSAMSREFEFFQSAILHITSSLDLPVSMERVFNFLRRYIPLSAISLHQYDSTLKGLKLLFLVTKQGFSYVEKFVPIPTQEGIAHLERQNRPFISLVEQSSAETPIAGYHSRAIREFLPVRPRAYMIGILGLGEDIVGHIALMGPGTHCFTEEHHRMFKLLLRPFSLAMVNMLQFKRTLDFQARLDAERTQLAVENRLLRGHNLIGATGGLREVFKSIEHLAGSELPVLLLGETGTGKEVVADAIQQISPRHDRPFVKVNCGAIPDTLIDSELFGFEKGAFTGAHGARAGFFEQADGGTLFLDEVGELPPQAQVRLLRVLQNGMVQRLGGANAIRVDVRIIAATNRNLGSMLQNGQFREDLYYRLNVFPIHIPPLRERGGDIVPLIAHFIEKSAACLGIPPPPVEPASLERLMTYSWPGNIRELENLVGRALTLDPGKPVNIAPFLPYDRSWHLKAEESGDYLRTLIEQRVNAVLDARLGASPQGTTLAARDVAPDPAALPGLAEANADLIRKALAQSRGKIHGPGGAAEILRINPSTLRKRMRKLGILARP